MTKAAPTTPDDRKARVVTALPTLAPVRVVLNVARGDEGHAADIQHALATAGVQTDLVPVDARRPTPSIGYYFQSDRNAAAGVSHLLTPLLGSVDPVALRIRRKHPRTRHHRNCDPIKAHAPFHYQKLLDLTAMCG